MNGEHRGTHLGQRPPAFQFYPLDFKTDMKVVLMTHEQRGIYWDLICSDWIEDGIPADIEDLAALVGMEYARFNTFWEKRIAKCFAPHPNKPGFLTNKRLEIERAKQKINSEKARASADTRWGKERRARDQKNQELADAMRPHNKGIAVPPKPACERNALRATDSSLRPSEETTTVCEQTNPARFAGNAATNYPAKAVEIWTKHTGGTMAHGEAGRILKPLVERYGEGAVLRVLDTAYFSQQQSTYWSLRNFATNYGTYAGLVKGEMIPGTVEDAIASSNRLAREANLDD